MMLGEQASLDTAAVAVHDARVVRRRLDRRPGWNPEWTDAGRLVEDRCDVASALEHCHAKSRVLQDRCAAAVESLQFDHGAYYLRPDRGLRRPGTVRRDASVTPLVCRSHDQILRRVRVFRTVELLRRSGSVELRPTQVSGSALAAGLFVRPLRGRVCPSETSLLRLATEGGLPTTGRAGCIARGGVRRPDSRRPAPVETPARCALMTQRADEAES